MARRFSKSFIMNAVTCLLLLVLAQGATGQNLAVGRPVAESSFWSTFNGALANDGNTDANFGSGSCYMAETDDNDPWWMVDLGSEFKINNVTLYNRGDCCGNRLSNIRIVVYREEPETSADTGIVCDNLKGGVADGAAVTLTCKSFTEGRYVRVNKIKSNSDDLLTLCEVEVTGEPAGEEDEEEKPAGCPPGFVAIAGECLLFVPSYSTFVEAITHCETMGSSLLMLKSDELNTAVGDYIRANTQQGEDFYVGGTDLEQQGVYRWLDGSLAQQNWDGGVSSPTESSDPNPGVRCGFLQGSTGLWKAATCSTSLYFICQKQVNL